MIPTKFVSIIQNCIFSLFQLINADMWQSFVKSSKTTDDSSNTVYSLFVSTPKDSGRFARFLLIIFIYCLLSIFERFTYFAIVNSEHAKKINENK